MKEIRVKPIKPIRSLPFVLSVGHTHTIVYLEGIIYLTDWHAGTVSHCETKFMRPKYGFLFADRLYVADEVTQLLYYYENDEWKYVENLIIEPASTCCFDGIHLWKVYDMKLQCISIPDGIVNRELRLKRPRYYSQLFIFKNTLHIIDGLSANHNKESIDALDVISLESRKPIIEFCGFNINDIIMSPSQVIFIGNGIFKIADIGGREKVYNGNPYHLYQDEDVLVISKCDECIIAENIF